MVKKIQEAGKFNRRVQLMQREDLAPDVRNEASGEILHQYLASDKAQQVLGWSPVAEVDAGLRETIGWYTDFLRQRAG